jgi:predicted RNA-binding protein YlqC (UPF0109 family)
VEKHNVVRSKGVFCNTRNWIVFYQFRFTDHRKDATMNEVNMQELVRYIASSLVDDPSQVRVDEIVGDDSIVYELRVAPEDMGRVIGKKGRVANAMRTLLRVVSARQGKRANLEIVS